MTLLRFLVDNPDLVALVGGAVASWFGIGRSRRTGADARATIAAALRGEAARMTAAPAARDASARALTRAAHDALHRVGIKPSSSITRIVGLAVEVVLAELDERAHAPVANGRI